MRNPVSRNKVKTQKKTYDINLWSPHARTCSHTYTQRDRDIGEGERERDRGRETDGDTERFRKISASSSCHGRHHIAATNLAKGWHSTAAGLRVTHPLLSEALG